ncbi:hypothetical protein SKAU_G00178320 [Synaphobranchus kaupii]|uniref:Uncharacterized protein n=1 Tax=Synaphobranchus kaupii TaxID=118154 RepID=A0A9Q1J1I9_SYNKA|nr:hypothetical protein SKAU_G00178320 [Synaphobranchus kaupii]
MYELYQTRDSIHRKACQHKVSSAIDTVIVDAFIKADGALKISDSLLDVTEHTKLTDGIYQKILHLDVKEELDARDKENLIKAQEILQRIERRDLYKCVCEIYFTEKEHKPITQVSQLLPNVFFEKVLHIYWKDPMWNENKIKALEEKAKQWCKEKGSKEETMFVSE